MPGRDSGSSSLIGTYFWEWDPNGSPSNVGRGIDSFSPQNGPAQHQAKLGFENAGGLGSSFDAAPDVAQSVANGTFLFKEANATETPTVAVMPHDGGAGFIGHFAAAAGDAANDHLSVGWHFEANTAAVSQTMIQSYAVTVAEPGPHGPTATRAISVTIGGQRSDTFVFKPGFGTDFIANATAANKIELDGFSSVTSLHELRMLLSEAQNGQSESLFHVTGHNTVIDLGNHDTIVLANVHLASLHASNFIIG